MGLPTGVGVFSHAVRLSHALRHPRAPGAGAVLRWEDVASDARRPSSTPVSSRVPRSRATARSSSIAIHPILHSAPDVAHREAVWRFM